ncbi:MAG: TetR/AcrR family transcriptional regulator, partial [Puniceicoccales bacterium]|nr:TetR/AcrR family transcriptional regulator [Puniceicoccales bacterium]
MAKQKTKKVSERKNTQGEKTRLNILRVSARLFAQRGYDGVSLRDIADEADVAASLIIHHFGNKAFLYRETVRHFLSNGDLYMRCVTPVIKANPDDKQAAADAVAESVHLFFDSFHGPNRIRHLDWLMLQVVFGRGSVDAFQTLDWIGPAERLFEDFIRRVNPEITKEEADVRMEVFFGDVFYTAVVRKLLLAEHGWREYPIVFLLKWKKVVATNFCLGIGLPAPKYLFPEEKDPDHYKHTHRPDIESDAYTPHSPVPAPELPAPVEHDDSDNDND